MPEDVKESFGFLQQMGKEAKTYLLDRCQKVSLPPHKDILQPGDRVNGVYLVTAGTIRVYYLDAAGGEGTLYWIRPGESCILALNSLFSDMPYPAWAATEETGAELLLAPGAVFRELFSHEPCLQSFFFEQLSSRVFGLMQTLEGTMRRSQEERLVALLLDLADQDGVVSLSQDRLARHLGTIREVVSRLLRGLAGRGLVTLAPRRTVILDRTRLKARLAHHGDSDV